MENSTGNDRKTSRIKFGFEEGKLFFSCSLITCTTANPIGYKSTFLN
jgi:hypothetical protein